VSAVRLALVHVVATRRRLFALGALCLVFLLAAFAASVFLRDADGDVHIDQLFVVGGYPAASAMLLIGWLIGRLPLIAVLVLMSGMVADDRANGLARLTAVRPVSQVAVYGARFLLLAAITFAVSALTMPLFDVLMLGEWAGAATFVLIAAYVFAYGGLLVCLSTWTRGDAWIALLLAIVAISWSALERAAYLPVAPLLADAIGFLLPPQPALFELEGAFAELEPIPWDAFLYCVGYGAFFLALAAISISRREV